METVPFSSEEMRVERTLLADGRYLIYFDFQPDGSGEPRAETDLRDGSENEKDV